MKIRWFLGLLVLILGACNLDTEYFKDYKGVNLISSRVFDTNGATNTWLVPTATAAAGSITFSNLGLTAGQDAWTLRAPNAILNGDFETAPASITQDAVGTVTFAGTVSDSKVLHGSKSYFINASGRTFTLNLTALPNPPASYQVQFDYRTNEFFQFSSDGGTSIHTFGWNDDFTQRTDLHAVDTGLTAWGSLNPFVGLQPQSNSNLILTWKRTTAYQLVLDDLSAVRTDVPLTVESTIPTLESTTAKLLPGIYEFSVYVLDDPAAGTNNILQPRTVSLGAEFTTTEGKSLFTASFARPSAGWTTWTKITLRMTNVNVPDILSPSATYALKLSISPTGSETNAKWASSVLVSQPWLEFKER